MARLRPGASLPAGLEVRVVEETPTTAYIVLPTGPVAGPGEELSDADLERAAGGSDITGWATCLADLVTWSCCHAN